MTLWGKNPPWDSANKMWNKQTGTWEPVYRAWVKVNGVWEQYFGPTPNEGEVLKRGGLYTWGNNVAGQVGDSTVTKRSKPVQIGSDMNWQGITGGFNFSVAINNNRLFSWGDNVYGTLGDGNHGASFAKSSPIQIGSSGSWYHVNCYASGQYVLAIDGARPYGKLNTWGRNDFGQLGTGDKLPRYSPTNVEPDVVSIAGGLTHSIFTRQGALSTGQNSYGQLGDGTTTAKTTGALFAGQDKDTFVAAGDSFTLTVGWYLYPENLIHGQLYACGRNNYGQLGLGDTNDRSVPVQVSSSILWNAISCGYRHALGINGGKLFAWGDNTYGQLGDGTRTHRSSPVQIGSSTDWQAVACGYQHSLAINNGRLYAWGDNALAQLGDGTSGVGTSKSSPVQVGSMTTWYAVAGGGSHSMGLAS